MLSLLSPRPCTDTFALPSDPVSAEQVSGGSISLFLQLPGSTTFEVVDTTGPLVGHLKKAIIAEFKLDTPQQHLLLFKLGDRGNRTPLEPRQTLIEAGILAGAKLEVEISVATRDHEVPSGMHANAGAG
jgi:hypothetical protein